MNVANNICLYPVTARIIAAVKTSSLKIFCDLVDTGSFSQAGTMNGVSQPAVSQQLARLERQLGAQLVSRGGGLLAATPAGKELYRRAREMLRIHEQMLGEIRSAANAVRGVLRVGTIYSVGFYLLHPVIREFLQAHPDVDFRVEYTHWSRIYASVINGEMDLGIVAYPHRQRHIEITPFVREQLVLVCPPDHRLARRKTVRPRELKGEKFVAFDTHIPTRQQIDATLRDLGVEVQVVMAFDNIEILKRAVEVGAGVSILPADNIDREVAGGRLCAVGLADPARWMRPLGIVRRRGRASTPAARMLLRLLRRHAQG